MVCAHTDDPRSALQINISLEGKYPLVPYVYLSKQIWTEKKTHLQWTWPAIILKPYAIKIWESNASSNNIRIEFLK